LHTHHPFFLNPPTPSPPTLRIHLPSIPHTLPKRTPLKLHFQRTLSAMEDSILNVCQQHIVFDDLLGSYGPDNALHLHRCAVVTLKLVTRAILLTFAFSFNLLIFLEVNWKTLKSSSSEDASKIPDSLPRLSSLIISGWGKSTLGGDRAAKSCLSLKGVIISGMLAANAARLSKNILRLCPSMAAWLLVMPNAKPPHLKDVTYMKQISNTLVSIFFFCYNIIEMINRIYFHFIQEI